LRSDVGLNKGNSLRPGDCAASMLHPGASSRDSSGVAAAVAQLKSNRHVSCMAADASLAEQQHTTHIIP
jgi:hypothetical protein